MYSCCSLFVTSVVPRIAFQNTIKYQYTHPIYIFYFNSVRIFQNVTIFCPLNTVLTNMRFLVTFFNDFQSVVFFWCTYQKQITGSKGDSNLAINYSSQTKIQCSCSDILIHRRITKQNTFKKLE